MPQPATPPLPVDGAILVFDSATNGAVVVPLALIDAQGNAALNSLTGPAFQHGVLSGLPTLGIGQSYFATDVNILYVGTAAGNSPTTALPLSGLAADIPQDSPVGLLYFATDTQVLYVALGQGNVKVVPAMLTGIKANLPNSLMLGVFYFATDTNQLYLGNASNAPVLIGPSSIQTGVAIFTGGTSSAVVFGTPYTGVLAPTVVVTGLDGVYTHGLSFSVVVAGTNGAWTGFTLYLSGALFGAFNWIAAGN